MKRLSTLWLVVLISINAFSQAPQKMSYQGVVRNNTGQLVTNTQIGMQISILQGTSDGTVVYSEVQTPTTNANGLVSIEIGGGNGFDTINWAAGPYFIKTETDPTGGATYTITSTSQLLSVPYALHAEMAETAKTAEILFLKSPDSTTYKITVQNDGTLSTEIFIEGEVSWGKFTDPRDGYEYKTVTISDQEWMAENLKYLPSVVGPGTGSQTDSYYYVYGYDGTNVADAKATSNYQTYGVLYNWPAALQVCPTGWHLPTDAEWIELTDYLIANGYNYDGTTTGNKIAKSLAMASGWNSYSGTGTVGNKDYPVKRNATGFSALPGGYRFFSDGKFYDAGNYGLWWCSTSTEGSSTVAYYWYLYYIYVNVIRNINNTSCGFSVRCVRD